MRTRIRLQLLACALEWWGVHAHAHISCVITLWRYVTRESYLIIHKVKDSRRVGRGEYFGLVLYAATVIILTYVLTY